MLLLNRLFGLAAPVLLTLALAAPRLSKDFSLEAQQSSSGKLVFCHFMIGIVSDRTGPGDYDADMQRAKAVGIDAFALNIGKDSYTDQQLGYAYQSAANNGMKVFISFDFNWFSPSADSVLVGHMIGQYAGYSSQLRVDNKVFASSFIGDGLNVAAMRSAAGQDVFWAPNFSPSQSNQNQVDGALNWMAWDSDGNNKAPRPGANVPVTSGDNDYRSWLGSTPYIAPVSPWFSTHFGPEVPYSKNWVFPGDLLWFKRWHQILAMQPPMLEIITWNDYGESHYVGPLSSKHTDDGSSKWVNDMPHGGWLDMAIPFIKAYHAGASSANSYITQDQLIYWYRPAPKSVNCDSTDSTMAPANNASGNYFHGKPNGHDTLADSIFVVSLLTSPGILTVQSGPTTQSFNAPTGAAAFTVPLGVGPQKFQLVRGDHTVLAATSLRDVVDHCPCGLYNFNAFVGTLPPGPADRLDSDGLARFTDGLLDRTCRAQPSLSTAVDTPGSTATATTTAQQSGATSVCVEGTVAPGMSGNYTGLCGYACRYGYCPRGPCVCTAYGAPVPTEPVTGQSGCPAGGLDGSYSGLCSFCCNHGFCPSGACRSTGC